MAGLIPAAYAYKDAGSPDSSPSPRIVLIITIPSHTPQLWFYAKFGMTASARPASLACLECRKVHVKCDGAKPACARCVSRDLLCSYTPSRRGRRRGEQHPRNSLAGALNTPQSSFNVSPSSQWMPDPSLETNNPRANISPIETVDTTATQPQTSFLPQGASNSMLQRIDPTCIWIDDMGLVNLFYLNFHPNHPILVPKTFYRDRDYPWYLKAVVEFIGSHFSTTITNRALQQDAAKKMEEEEDDLPAVIQARILYATILLARHETQLCQQVLAHAIDTARRIGLYRRDFAPSHADGHPVEEESLRRTWYELYVLDGCIAASHPNTSFKTYSVDADVLLPCGDSIYDNGMPVFTAYSRSDFENRVFIEEDITFSSSSYRIEATRLLGRVLTITGKHGVQRERVQSIDNALTAFLHHLPPCKRETEIVKTSGDIDGLMFQTHTIVQYATILLHFPRGDLVPLGPIAAEISGDSTAKFVCPCTRQHVHSVKAIDASKAISMLATFRIPIQKHTPLFIYPLVLCAMVQLSLCTSHRNDPEILEHHRDCVKLILGVLKSMGEYWATAQVLLRALKKRALRVFRNGAGDAAQQENDLSGGASPFVFANSGGDGSGEMMQEDFGSLMDFDELMSFDNRLFCF